MFSSSKQRNDPTLGYTISEIYRLSQEYQDDTPDFKNIFEVFDYTRRISYVRDTDACGFDECLKRPAITMQYGGDCDDKTIFAGAAFNRLNIPWRVVTTSHRDDGQMDHVFPEVWYGGAWQPFDATYLQNKIFTESQSTARLVWEKDMNQTVRNGVATLEGDLGIGETEILNALSDVGKILSTLPIIGGIFKGSTQHVDFNEAVAFSNKVGASWINLRNLLDPNGKTLMDRAADQWFMKFKQDYGSWWGSFILKDIETWETKGWLDNAPTATYHKLAQPIYWICVLVDRENLDWELNQKYYSTTRQLIKTPIEQYVMSTQGITVDQLQQNQQQQQQSSSSSALTSNATPWLIAAGVGLLLFAKPGRRSRR